jgi:hypothetical protein
MKILFLHGLNSIPGGVKPTYLVQHGHTVINSKLPDDYFAAALAIAQAEFDRHRPDVVVGSSRGGALAMNLDSTETPLVLLCPAWKKYGTANTVKPNTTILHSRADDVVPFADSEELVRNSGLSAWALVEVGGDHRLADPESLEMMLRACVNSCVPDWSDSEEELLKQEWGGRCYTAAMRWITVARDHDWIVVHGTVLSEQVGRRIDHAWCERGEVVVDLAMPVGSRIVQRQRYYRAVQPEIRKQYSSDDALILSVKDGHHGPWVQSEQLEPQ